MVVRSTGDQIEAGLRQACCQCLGILKDTTLIILEFGLKRFPQGHRLGGDDMLQRPALRAGENGGINLLGKLLFAQDHTAPGAPKRLMGRGAHHIGIGHGRGVEARGDQPRNMGHVHKEVGPHLMGDLCKSLKINDPWVGGGAGNDHLGLVLLCHIADLVVIDASVSPQPVGDHVVVLAGKVDGRAVGEVASIGEIHAQHRVPVLAQRRIDGIVGLSTAVGLDVGMLCAEKFAGALTGDILRNVHLLAAAVIALAGVSFGIFVGEHRAHGHQNRLADDILRRDELDVSALTRQFSRHGGCHLWVLGGKKVDHFLYHCRRTSPLSK